MLIGTFSILFYRQRKKQCHRNLNNFHKVIQTQVVGFRSCTILTTIPSSYHNIQRSLAVSSNNENSINGSYDGDSYHSNGNSIPIGNCTNHELSTLRH